jgi:hypothetical protein
MNLNVYLRTTSARLSLIIVVGLAPRQDMLYMLSLNIFHVMNMCDVTNERKRSTSDNETSLKLWHCRLAYILRGRMEHLIKEEIL